VADSFHRVTRSLRADNGLRSALALVAALSLLAAWLGWAFCFTVPVELTVTPRPPERIAVEHAPRGSAQTKVERVSPAALLLRSATELAGAH